MTSLWQITNGKKFAQLIFSGENLIDCEFLKEGGDVVDEFVETFVQEYNHISRERNSDFGSARHHKYHESSNLNENVFKNVTIVNLEKLQQIPEHFLELMNLKTLQKKCIQLHRQIRHKLQNEDQDDKNTESELEVEMNGR